MTAVTKLNKNPVSPKGLQTGQTQLQDLLDTYRPGHSLPALYYRSPDVWEADRKLVLSDVWHLAGHESRIPEPGDYFVLELLGEAVIVTRDNDRKVRAFFNNCRHRGSPLCLNKSGRTKAFVCPYHAWTYSLDGRLKGAPLMQPGFEKSDYGLYQCHVATIEGIIFINLADEPVEDFDAVYSPFADVLKLYGVRNTKIAHIWSYRLEANWKHVIENGVECYHCPATHPELCSTRSTQNLKSIGLVPEQADQTDIAKFKREVETWQSQIANRPDLVGMLVDDDENSTHLRNLSRYPLKAGFLSESKDGRPVSLPLGNLGAHEGSSAIGVFNPWSWAWILDDYVVLHRWSAVGPETTEIELTWLVREDAEEGRDYNLDDLLYVNKITTLQDKDLILMSRNGCRSDRYQPGPFSRQERLVDQFCRWYTNKLKSRYAGSFA
ncbi:aromatic ring-hydroxylating oxygenase subunit alpha [Sphingosinicella xenopeptidilytica]|uniref:Aromatic ring-hydroxylating dioxygenase subunit alpha n=1 Tax=Sphingosinicella xenopeptidilytica TaxID=364098 RepID=A0ABW3C7X3_SPHXN